MSQSINVDVSQLPLVTADVIVDPTDLEIVSTGVKVKDGHCVPNFGNTGEVLTKFSNSPYDIVWQPIPASGGSGRSGGFDLVFAAASGTTTEICYAALKIPAAQGGFNGANGIWGVRIKIFGGMKGGGTLATFTPRLRCGASRFDITGTIIQATPTIVAANNTTNAPFELEYMVVIQDTVMNMGCSLSMIEHTSNAGGAAVVNCAKTAGVNVGSGAGIRWLNLTIQNSVTGTAAFNPDFGVYEIINFVTAQ